MKIEARSRTAEIYAELRGSMLVDAADHLLGRYIFGIVAERHIHARREHIKPKVAALPPGVRDKADLGMVL